MLLLKEQLLEFVVGLSGGEHVYPDGANQKDDRDTELFQPVELQPGVPDVVTSLERVERRMNDHKDPASGQNGSVRSQRKEVVVRTDVERQGPVASWPPAFHFGASVVFRLDKRDLIEIKMNGQS